MKEFPVHLLFFFSPWRAALSAAFQVDRLAWSKWSTPVWVSEI
jgi:hypothetical protein